MCFTKLLYTCLVIFFEREREYRSCLVSFLSFPELFPALYSAKEIGNLLSIWLGTEIFNPCPDCFCLLNLRVSSAISTISSGFSFFFHFQTHFLVSSCKPFNPLINSLLHYLFLDRLFCIDLLIMETAFESGNNF